MGFQVVPVLGDGRGAEEHRHQLVAALADLPPYRVEGDPVAVIRQGVDPGPGMLIDRIDEGPSTSKMTMRGAAVIWGM